MTHLDDFANSVRAVTMFTNEPGLQHWKVMLKILAYVARIRDLGPMSPHSGYSFARRMLETSYPRERDIVSLLLHYLLLILIAAVSIINA